MLKLATFRGRSDEGEPLVQVFHPGDSLRKVAAAMMPEIQTWISSYRSDPGKVAILVNALGASEFWGQNINGDIFPEGALVHDCGKHPDALHPVDDFTGKRIPPYGAWTFKEFARAFSHHRNKDPSRAFGTVEAWCWNPRMRRVELVVLLDRAAALEHGAQDVVDRIDAGEFPDVSMGCRVPYDECSICHHKSKTSGDYCSCLKEMRGQVLADGRRVGMINDYPRFFDISFVFIGADKTAKVMCKLGSVWMPLSAVEGERVYGREEEYLVKAAGVELTKPGETEPSGPNYSRTDNQQPEKRKTVPSGIIRTNEFSADETTGGVNIPTTNFGKSASSLSSVFEAAKDIKIGPPPKKNREKFPFTGTIDFKGLSINVENKPGDVREGVGASGKKWRTEMKLPYGEFVGTLGVDQDKLDVYVGPYRDAPNVFIIHQNFADGPNTGMYDEDKVMLGFENGEQAKQAYLAHYDDPKFFRSITTMAFPLFKKALQRHEMEGEKMAAKLVKTAQDLRLEDLFTGHREAQRRERTWKGKGKQTTVIGSGMESSEKAKEAAISPEAAMPITAQNVLEKSEAIAKSNPDEILEGRDLKYESRSRAIKALQLTYGDKWKDVLGKRLGISPDLIVESDKPKKVKAPKPPRPKLSSLEPPETPEPPKVRVETPSPSQEEVKLASVREHGFSPEEILKVSNDSKVAAHLKWADILKEIGPERAVGRVSKLLSEREPDIPRDTLNEMGSEGVEKGLSTSGLMGMVLKPREFQRVCLVGMGREPLADKLDDAGATFGPSDESSPLWSPLGPEHLGMGLLRKLLPLLQEKSYFGPPIRRRIIRITIVKPIDPVEESHPDSPILSKLSSAYNWYRREQMKLAADAMDVVTNIPDLHAGIYGIGPGDLFSKSAGLTETFDPKTLALLLGSVPLTLMYSAHQQARERRGEELGLLNRLIANHPWLTTLGVGAGLRELMKIPQIRQAVAEAASAGKRILTAGSAPA